MFLSRIAASSLIAFTLIALTTGVAQAQERAGAAAESSEATIARLQREVEILKQKVDILSKTVADLRARLDGTGDSSSPPIAPRPAIDGSAAGERVNPLIPPAPRTAAEVLGQVKPAPVANETTPAKPEPASETIYTSFEQILAALPPDARPDENLGWNEVRAGKAQAWLEKNVVGKRLAVRLTLFDKAVVGVVQADDNNPTRYRMEFEFQPERFRYLDMTHEVRVKDAAGVPLTSLISEAVARGAARNLRTGQVLPVAGTIKSITLPLATSTRSQIDITIDNYVVANFK